MKILVVGINYAPELIGIGKYTTEMCNELRRKGHEVTVVTAPPYYPDWRIVKPYSGFAYSSEVVDGIEVVRCPLYVPSLPRAFHRILHHLSFAITSAPAILVQALKVRPDVVLSVAPSLLSAPAALVAGKLSGAATWLHIQDFEVDAAFNLNFLSGGWLRRAALWCEKKLLTSFDLVSAISAKMVDLLHSKGVSRFRAFEFRNWVDTAAIESQLADAARAEWRSALLERASGTLVLYSGNIGAKQGFEVLAEAARRLAPDRPDIVFVFCGAGAMKERLMQSTADLPNVRFLELQPAESFRKLLISADIHLLPQCSEIQDLALPSKLGGMLVSGRPIVAMAAAETQLASELADVGVVVAPGDPDAVIEAVLRLASDSKLRDVLGTNGQHLAHRRWERGSVLAEAEARLLDLLARRRKGATGFGLPVSAAVRPQVAGGDDLKLPEKKPLR
ncbi:MAG: WcaI family glycosyltransferase [Xanthobacteraceae bacterium]|nr:WcaI family glycosyltransferase [Xanthobacteraceae bacterium]